VDKHQLVGLVILENIYYLTSPDHRGFFSCHILIVPLSGDLVIAARVMDGATVTNQVNNARFVGHSDTENAGEFSATTAKSEGPGNSRLGLEKSG